LYYRKAAQQWHPDNFHGDDKKMAEKKFIDIAAAKEVLTNPGTFFILLCINGINIFLLVH
jgi:curved DNA-binding protein CbpA